MKNKKIYIILIIIFIVILSIFFITKKNNKTYNKNLFYMDTYINIKITTNKGDKKANNILNEVDSIYKNVHELTNAYDETSEIYYINNNDSTSETIKINEDIYEMLKLGLEWYEKSNGKFNINMGKIIKLWKKYREENTGIPTSEEIEEASDIDISQIVLLDNYEIKNTHPNIDLGAIAKGYATEKVGDYLEENGITNYIINAGGNVLVGEKDNDTFKVGLQSPIDSSSVFKIIKTNNNAVVTSGGYERFYEYNGVRYHHIIDPSTMYPANNMLSVSVITPSSTLADIMSTTLFLMTPEEALELVNNMDDVECIIYTNDNEILTSEGISKYE